MSFLNIKNHEERDAMIEDFLALKEKLAKRSMEERGDLMERHRDLEENFEPVVASNKNMAKEIVNQLTPIQEQLQELNNKAARSKLLATPTIGVKRGIDSQPKSKTRFLSNFGPHADEFLQKYLNPDNKQVDKTFGIRYENGKWMIGNKQIEIDADDIIIDDEVYEDTPGLWSLITTKLPKHYTESDMERYKELLYETSALHQHYDSSDPYPRASGSKKWKQILAPIWVEFQSIGVVTSSDADSLDGTLIDNDYDEFHSISGDSASRGDGVKMFLQKDKKCFALQKCGNGLKFTPRPKLTGIRGDGLYLRAGSGIYDGQGLILGPQSPFKNIPILGWIL